MYAVFYVWKVLYKYNVFLFINNNINNYKCFKKYFDLDFMH